MALPSTQDAGLRFVVRLVALLNLGYFGIEFAVAVAIGSVSLFADSVDFLEDASVNLLIAVALGWTPRARARLGMALAAILLVRGWPRSGPHGQSSWHRRCQRHCRCQ